MTRRFGAALSENPSPAHAAGEVVADVMQLTGPGPDVAFVYVTGPFLGALEDVCAVVRETLRPATLVGVTAVSVLAGTTEVEESASVALWAGHCGAVTPVHLEVIPDARGAAGEQVVVGMPDEAVESGRTLVLFADPFSFPTDQFLRSAEQQYPALSIIGGLASAARGPGGNRLVLDDQVLSAGAVGVLLESDAGVCAVVSQGCRPIGDPFTVTSASGNLILELGGRPAAERLAELINGATEDDRVLIGAGLHIGIVADDQREDFRRGDFLIRAVLGTMRESKALAVGDAVSVGSVVQFQVRDAASAHDDLVALLPRGGAQAALVFTCNGRGSRLFDLPNHDAETVTELTGSTATAGMFCAGEIGPIAGRSFVHGFTASVLLFN